MGKVPDEIVARAERFRPVPPKVFEAVKDTYRQTTAFSPQLRDAIDRVRTWRAEYTDLSSESFRLNVAVVVLEVDGHEVAFVKANQPEKHSEVGIYNELKLRYGDFNRPSVRDRIKVKLIYSERQFCAAQCRAFVRNEAAFREAQKFFSVIEQGTWGERAQILEQMWLKPPEKPPQGGPGKPSKGITRPAEKKGKGAVAEPEDVAKTSAAELETRKAVENRGSENRGTEDRGRARTPEQGGFAADERIAPHAYEVDPGGSMEAEQGKVAGAEGAAMMIYENLVEKMHKDAWRQAEKAYDRDNLMRNKIFDERRSGDWVLVRFNFLETDAPDSQGNRYIRFWNVSYQAASPKVLHVDQVSIADFKSRQEYEAYIAEALHKVRMPQTESAYAGPRVNVSVPSGWHVKSQDYQLLPPQDERGSGSILDDYRNVGKIRGTVGRCTR